MHSRDERRRTSVRTQQPVCESQATAGRRRVARQCVRLILMPRVGEHRQRSRFNVRATQVVQAACQERDGRRLRRLVRHPRDRPARLFRSLILQLLPLFVRRLPLRFDFLSQRRHIDGRAGCREASFNADVVHDVAAIRTVEERKPAVGQIGRGDIVRLPFLQPIDDVLQAIFVAAEFFTAEIRHAHAVVASVYIALQTDQTVRLAVAAGVVGIELSGGHRVAVHQDVAAGGCPRVIEVVSRDRVTDPLGRIRSDFVVDQVERGLHPVAGLLRSPVDRHRR